MRLFLLCLILLFVSETYAVERLSLDVVSYTDFVQETPEAISLLKKALYEKGIVGIKGIPGYKEKVLKYIETARKFSALPEEIKESYAPNHDLGEMFLGYEKGKEKFKRPDGKWVVDDLKVSYYAFVPNQPANKWPKELDLKTPFQDLGDIMSVMGDAVMKKIGLIGPTTEIDNIDSAPRMGRLLYYRSTNVERAARRNPGPGAHGKMSGGHFGMGGPGQASYLMVCGKELAAHYRSGESPSFQEGVLQNENPLWCGAHFDHGLFTGLLPAFYFVDGEAVPEPLEAGLFVRTTAEGEFRKVVADDPDVLMFQVGEFGQLMMNDGIRATEHRVHKASVNIERYTMALFFDPPMDIPIHSYSELTKDSRYGGKAGDPCPYRYWHEESFKRYLVKEEAN